jgi:hypothetical protein
VDLLLEAVRELQRLRNRADIRWVNVAIAMLVASGETPERRRELAGTMGHRALIAGIKAPQTPAERRARGILLGELLDDGAILNGGDIARMF